MFISFDIKPFILILIGISTCFCIIYFLWELFRYNSLKKSIQKSAKKRKLTASDSCNESQGVSIVIYSDNEESQLRHNLQNFLTQDYPLYEIIVVNNGKNEDIQDYVERLALHHDNLHYSFIPDDASNLSHKKLALMIGYKAAKYDILLTTNAHCSPQSDKWVSSMACHFTEGTEVVIGHSVIANNSDITFGFRIRAFLALRNSVKYLSQAITGKPYRGTGNNIAYRKSLFFKNKGFHRSMHLHYGDDDLFINEIATKNNTCVEISPESFTTAYYRNAARVFSNLKLRHTFTESMIRSSAFLSASLSTIRFYCCIVSAILVVIFGFSNIVTLSAGILLLLSSIIPQILIYRKTAKILKSRELTFSVPLFSLLQPIINFYYKLNSRRHTDYNYTWQRLKN